MDPSKILEDICMCVLSLCCLLQAILSHHHYLHFPFHNTCVLLFLSVELLPSPQQGLFLLS